VAQEHTHRSMSTDTHGDRLWNSCTDHVAHGCAAQIVEELPFELGLLAGRCPRATELANWLPMTVKHVLRQTADPRRRANLPSSHSARDQFPQRACERQRGAMLALGGAKRDLPRLAVDRIPAQTENLAFAPTREERKPRHLVDGLQQV